MKKAMAIVIAATLVISMTACSKAAVPTNQDKPAEAPKQAEPAKPAEKKVDKLPDFSIKDLEGNTITNDFFKDNKLTIVTVWSTT